MPMELTKKNNFFFRSSSNSLPYPDSFIFHSMLQISLHYLVILRYQNYELGWAKLNTFIWRPRGTGVESTSRGDGTVFPCPVVSTSRPWASRRLSKQTNWCEVEVVFNERTIRPENRLGAFGERET